MLLNSTGLMKNLVYVSPILSAESFGGSVVAKANLNAIRAVFAGECTAVSLAKLPAEHDVHIAPSRSKPMTALCNLLFLAAGLTPAGLVRIVKLCRALQPDVVWLDSSFLGILIPFLRLFCRNPKIVVFVHDAEPPIVRAQIRKNPLYLISWLAIRVNELLTCRLADGVFAIQPNDGRMLSARGAKRVEIIGVSLADQVEPPMPTVTCASQGTDLLFVGSDFPPNVEAMAHMNDVLAPLLRPRTIVCVGNGLDKYTSRFPNLRIKGRVPDLAPYYQSAFAVLAPIYSGGGMKVKIAEALMFNRHVVCSAFAALGYEASISHGVWVADTPAAFVEAIDGLADTDCTDPRAQYLEHYSPASLRRSVATALSNLGQTVRT